MPPRLPSRVPENSLQRSIHEYLLQQVSREHGTLYGTAAKSIVYGSTGVDQILAPTSDIIHAYGFSNPSPGRLLYIGEEPQTFMVRAVTTLSANAANVRLTGSLSFNGTTDTRYQQSIDLKAVTDRWPLVIEGPVKMEPKDYLEVAVQVGTTCTLVVTTFVLSSSRLN